MVRDPRECVNLGPIIGTRIFSGGGAEAVHACKDQSIKETTWPQCEKCPLFCTSAATTPNNKPKKTKVAPEPPTGLIVNQAKQVMPLANTWSNGHIFLTLSGPSLKLVPPEAMTERGIVSFGVNNSATVIRPTFWTYGDKGDKFHNVIWEDPGIIKFMPVRGWHKKHPHMVRNKNSDGSFATTDKQGRFMPGVLGYERNAVFNPAVWLHEPTCNWGNSKKAAEENKLPHILNIMFVVFRLSYYLGFRHIYLLGCDFNMVVDQPYAFDENKNPGACTSNNGTYLKLNYMFSLLKPHFDEVGLQVFNCTPGSGFRTFSQLPFKEAMDNAKRNVPATIDTKGWYDS